MKFAKSDSGSSMIEFAFVAPILLLMMVGMIELGRFAYFSILAANSARAGAQYAAQNLSTAMDTSGIKTAIQQDGQNLSNWTSGVTAQYLCSTNGGSTLQACSSTPASNNIYYVKVQVTGTFSSLLHYPGIPHQLPVSGSSLMRVASQ